MMVLVVSAVVKPNADQAFAEQFERHLFPSLQVQPGFRGEIVLVSPGAPEVILITFWDSDANARSYERSAWPESVKTLTNILNPAVFRRFQLAHSTLHPEGVATFPCSRRLRRNRPEWSGGRPARRLVGGSQIQPEECAISFFHTTRDATSFITGMQRTGCTQ